MIPVCIAIGLIILAAAGRRVSRLTSGGNQFAPIAIACGSGVAAALVVVAGLSAPYSPWDMVRLAPSMALARGIDPYASEHSGAVLSTMYGPAAVAAYVPAAVFGDSAFGAICGRWLAFAFAFGPLLMTSRATTNSAGREWRILVLVLGTLAMVLSPALKYSSTFVHADAPALGLAGFACLFANKGRRPGVMVAVLCVLAVFAKQTMVTLPLALLVWTCVVRGRAAAMRFGVELALVGILIGSCFLTITNPRALYLNLVQVPGGVPWRGQVPWNLVSTSFELLFHAAPLLAALALVGQYRTKSATGSAHGISEESSVVTEPAPWSAVSITAIALAPMAILGRVKDAGDINSFSPCLYPLLLAVISRASELVPVVHMAIKRSAVVALSMLSLLGATRLSEEIRLLTKERPLHVETVFLKTHPGAVYFPWNPSAHLAAEGKPTHHLFSAWERGVAGFPVEAEHLRSAIPSTCRYVAFPLKRLGPSLGFGSCVQMLEKFGLMDRDAPPVRLAELPDYECYELTR